jgi:hypothetical protein
MLQNDWDGKIETTKNCLTTASVWKGWRPDLICNEFFADQNEVNFRDMKGTRRRLLVCQKLGGQLPTLPTRQLRPCRPDMIFREFFADQNEVNFTDRR